jgi:hypothetical protein
MEVELTSPQSELARLEASERFAFAALEEAGCELMRLDRSDPGSVKAVRASERTRNALDEWVHIHQQLAVTVKETLSLTE